jgi:lipoprotein-anchoring transpeptidase ErfK/SrfK
MNRILLCAALYSVAAVAPNAFAAEAAQANASPKLILAEAEKARVEGRYLEAKPLYQQLLQQAPSPDVAALVQKGLGEVNLKLILSNVMGPNAGSYAVKSGDTLGKIAKSHNTTVELLKASNGLLNDRIRIGQRLKIVKSKFSVLVDKSQNTLTLKDGEEVLKIYQCSTGKDGITPVGTFKIINRIVDPPWYSPNGLIPARDPKNELGTRWLGFDEPGYGIHGTIDPASIGKPVTQGCVRLANREVEELFTLLPTGTQVTIVE